MAEPAEEDSPHVRQLRAALHLTVGRLCAEVTAERGAAGRPFDRATIATLTEATLAQAAVMARDLELFAQHARRAVVGPDDVKLLVRRSPGLAAEVQREARRLAAAAEAGRERRKAARGRKAAQGADRPAVAAPPPPDDPHDADTMVVEL